MSEQFQGGTPTPQGEGLPPQGGIPQGEGLGTNLDTAVDGQARLQQQYQQQFEQQQATPPQQQQSQQPETKTYTQEQWSNFQRTKDQEVANAQRQAEAQERIATQMQERVAALSQQHQQMTAQWTNFQAQQMDPDQRAQFFQQQNEIGQQQMQQQMQEFEQREQMRQMKWNMANQYNVPISELVSDDYGQDSQYVMSVLDGRAKELEQRAVKAEQALAAYQRGEQASNSVYPGENKSPPQANAWQAKYEDALKKVMSNEAPTALVDEVRHGAHMAGVELDFAAAERISIGY